MFLVIGMNTKPVPKEEIVEVKDFVLPKFKTQQKKAAFEMARKVSSNPSAISYAFFGE